MKKISNFLPLIVLLALITLSGLAVYNSSTKQNIGKPELSSDLGFIEEKYRVKLREFSLVDLYDDNKNFSLKDLQNDENRYSLVNFFASWCTTCLAEHNVLMRLKNEKSINFYGVAWHDYSKNAIDYLKTNGNPYHKTALDAKGLFTKILNINAIPETLLFDSSGVLVLRFQGNLDEAALSQILEFANKK